MNRLPALALAVCVSGCALMAGPGQEPPLPPGLAARVELAGVPFYAQDAFQCGPAALAMALNFAGAARTPQELQGQVYLPQRKGSLQPEMLAAARRAGLIAYPLASTTGALFAEVAGGHPVIVLQNLGWDIAPQWHYAVVIGYDLAASEVILRSGTDARRILSRHDFESSWAKAGRWGFVALEPGQLPATAREDDFAAAAANLERVAPDAARVAYGTTLAKWPTNTVARIGLGNIAYASHELPEAERQYRRATLDHADSADAWNNLAQVLLETGQRTEALAAAQRAVAIGGARRDTYASTRDAIASAPAN